MTSIELSSSNPARIRANAVVIGVLKKGDGIKLAPGSTPVGTAYGRTLTRALTSLGATGDAGQVTRIPKAGSVAVACRDRRWARRRRSGRRGAASRSRQRRTRRGRYGQRRARAAGRPPTEELRAVAEGALFGAYAFTTYRKKSAKAHKAPVKAVTVATPLAQDKDAAAVVTEVKTVAKSLNLVRDLINTAPSDLHPGRLRRHRACRPAAASSSTSRCSTKRPSPRASTAGSSASAWGRCNPPRLVRIAYRHPKAKRHLAFVGKGITFDSGGISIKPAANMDAMKSDMSGAAAVLGAMTAIGRLKPEVNVTGYMAMAENMPSGSAQRPSDVITIRGGQTVEVLNTDAEGRLVLADAIVQGRRGQARHDRRRRNTHRRRCRRPGQQDVAGSWPTTTTSAPTSTTVATSVGEQMWPMMLPPELRSSMDSKVADIANIGDR